MSMSALYSFPILCCETIISGIKMHLMSVTWSAQPIYCQTPFLIDVYAYMISSGLVRRIQDDRLTASITARKQNEEI